MKIMIAIHAKPWPCSTPKWGCRMEMSQVYKNLPHKFESFGLHLCQLILKLGIHKIQGKHVPSFSTLPRTMTIESSTNFINLELVIMNNTIRC